MVSLGASPGPGPSRPPQTSPQSGRPDCPTARLPHGPTAPRPDCPTARLPHGPTAPRPDCPKHPDPPRCPPRRSPTSHRNGDPLQRTDESPLQRAKAQLSREDPDPKSFAAVGPGMPARAWHAGPRGLSHCGLAASTDHALRQGAAANCAAANCAANCAAGPCAASCAAAIGGMRHQHGQGCAEAAAVTWGS
jgi:hypothetical protein